MTRTWDTLTDAEVAAYIEARRHRPRRATGYDIHSQRMKWAVEEMVEERRVHCHNIAARAAMEAVNRAERAPSIEMEIAERTAALLAAEIAAAIREGE